MLPGKLCEDVRMLCRARALNPQVLFVKVRIISNIKVYVEKLPRLPGRWFSQYGVCHTSLRT